MVRHEGDVTRHAEMVAVSAAQQILRTRSLHDCTLYSTIEPCAMCSYAIRESRIGRVIFGLQSPVMGGHSRWNILMDRTLSSVVPEVFAPPPYVLAGRPRQEVRKLFRSQHPLAWHVIEGRRIFVAEADGAETTAADSEPALRWKQQVANWVRSSTGFGAPSWRLACCSGWSGRARLNDAIACAGWLGPSQAAPGRQRRSARSTSLRNRPIRAGTA